MAAHSGIGVPRPGRRITGWLRARLLGRKLVREVEEFLAGRW
jgi:hypothetical protein